MVGGEERGVAHHAEQSWERWKGSATFRLLFGQHERRDQSCPPCKGCPGASCSAKAVLQASLTPGNGSAERFLHLPKGNVIRVPLSGPEEAFEAILVVAWHEVDMDVGDALADVIVDGDERPIG